MRIRTDGDYAHRKSTIEAVAGFYDCNKTKAMLLAADQVPELHDAVETVLSRDDLTQQQREEIAATFNQARGLDVEVTQAVEIGSDD